MKNLGLIFLLGALQLPAEQPLLPEKISFDRQYELFDLAFTAADLNRAAPEHGSVKFKRKKHTLYVELEMDDIDCINTSRKDQEAVHRNGDAVRLFLRPAGCTGLWELQTASNGRKGVFLHWGAGEMLYPESSKTTLPGFTASVKKNRQRWQCRMKVELDEAARKLQVPINTRWQIMVMRYNYGKNHPRRNVSSFPQAVINIPDARRFALLPDPGR